MQSPYGCPAAGRTAVNLFITAVSNAVHLKCLSVHVFIFIFILVFVLVLRGSAVKAGVAVQLMIFSINDAILFKTLRLFFMSQNDYSPLSRENGLNKVGGLLSERTLRVISPAAGIDPFGSPPELHSLNNTQYEVGSLGAREIPAARIPLRLSCRRQDSSEFSNGRRCGQKAKWTRSLWVIK